MTTVTLFTAILTLGIGVAVLTANSRRFSNQMFAVLSLHIAVWLGMIVGVTRIGALGLRGAVLFDELLPWLRAEMIVAALFPLTLRALLASVVSGPTERGRVLARLWPWLGFGILLASLCFHASFFRLDGPAATHLHRGAAYYVYALGQILASLAWVLEMAWKFRTSSGVRKLELRFLLFAFGLPSLLIPVLNSAGHYIQMRGLIRGGIALIFCGYVLTALAIAFQWIFDARQVMVSLVHRVAVGLLFAGASLGLTQVVAPLTTPDIAVVLSIALCGIFIIPVDRLSRRWLRIDDEEAIAEFRAKAIALARSEANPDKLVAALEALLCEQSQASFAALLLTARHARQLSGLAFPRGRPGCEALGRLGWATPERLQRRRSSPELDDLQHFLGEHALGVVVAVPRGSTSPSLLVAVGTKLNQSPFTYTEVQRLQVVGELMDNILAHSRLTSEAALKAKMEHLAMMSRGLAHDLKNLITPISSFIVHAEGKAEAGSAEEEVHAAAQRSVRLMTEYVREALFFSSRLTPRYERAELARLLASVRELSSARAAERKVEVAVAHRGPTVCTVDTVLVQRLLGNLISNAIDASSAHGKVTAVCAEPSPGWMRFEVVDQGCGIPSENLARIFEPYFTTKQFGDDVRGFGLGLTICEKIVNLHQGTIFVRSEPGRGTTVTVDLPCSPPAHAAAGGAALPA